ncbi:MAG: hypothetical protein IJT74_01375, partial [Bacteroidales bacterium]|nr:hypothetical protein [Bacteroidales bacterium]
MRTSRLALFVLVVAVAFSCDKERLPHTDRTRGLIKELLIKLDSTDAYAARKEQQIEALKQELPGETVEESFRLYYNIAMAFSNNVADSSLYYLEKAVRFAESSGIDTLWQEAQIALSAQLSEYGYYLEAHETISSVPREKLEGRLLIRYYRAM